MSTNGSARRILVVDDARDIRETLHELLTDEGYEVELAVNGKEALDRLKSDPTPRVILLDLMMPVMNGLEFLDVLHRMKWLPRFPVVILSAQDIQVPYNALRLPKPFDLEALLQHIREQGKRL